jgi:quercetin dioxygenase-like cupin family protein
LDIQICFRATGTGKLAVPGRIRFTGETLMPKTDGHGGKTQAPRREMYGGEVVARDFSDWSPELKDEFARNEQNYQVGGRLLSETDKVKVWEIRLAPGERLPAHRHILDYFWTVLTSGDSLQHNSDGTTRRVSYKAGDTRHSTIGPGDVFLHDLNNVGDSELIFVTVEHQRSPGDPGSRQV